MFSDLIHDWIQEVRSVLLLMAFSFVLGLLMGLYL